MRLLKKLPGVPGISLSILNESYYNVKNDNEGKFNMLPKKTDDKDNELVSSSCAGAGSTFSGYQFQNDSIANQMAYTFGGPHGEAEAEAILNEANTRFPDPLQIKDKRKFIEEKIKSRSAQKIDTHFQSGLSDMMKSLSQAGVSNDVKGEQAGKQAMIGIMKGLGLNVDENNTQTHYSPGPPQVFHVTFINRPTPNVAQKDSNVSKLADTYKSCLSHEEQEKFKSSWDSHVTNAQNGGPKIDKAKFEQKADESFKQAVANAKRKEAGLAKTASKPQGNRAPSRLVEQPSPTPSHRH